MKHSTDIVFAFLNESFDRSESQKQVVVDLKALVCLFCSSRSINKWQVFGRREEVFVSMGDLNNPGKSG